MQSCDTSPVFNGRICLARYLVPRVCGPFGQRVSTHRDSKIIEAIFKQNKPACGDFAVLNAQVSTQL